MKMQVNDFDMAKKEKEMEKKRKRPKARLTTLLGIRVDV